MSKYFLKIDSLSGQRSRGPLGNADIPFFSKHKTWLGRILADLNALKRRRHISINSRWEISSGYYLISGWTSGVWNRVKFGKEVLRGDYSYTTTNNWFFRSQVAGTYLVNANVTIEASSMQDASIGLYKNGTLFSRMKTVQSRIYDIPATNWHYHTTIDLAGAVDQVYLNIGDQIEIRVYYDADSTDAGITNIVGYVNVALVGDTKGTVALPSDNW